MFYRIFLFLSLYLLSFIKGNNNYNNFFQNIHPYFLCYNTLTMVTITLYFMIIPLCEKCSITELFLVRIFLYSLRIQKIWLRNNSVFGHFWQNTWSYLTLSHSGTASKNNCLMINRIISCYLTLSHCGNQALQAKLRNLIISLDKLH